jgi:membrane-associated phospholipid phosphatase
VIRGATIQETVEPDGVVIDRDGGYGHRGMRAARRVSVAPVLDPMPGGLPARIAERLGWHPAATFAGAMIAGFAAISLCSIVIGLLVTEIVLKSGGIMAADEWLPDWLAAHRSPEVVDASLVGSIISGGVVLPILVGVVALACAALRQWRVAAFVVLALAVESGTYRATTLVIERERPDVERLENLPADASYPSGHTAASVAVYAGLVLLVSSRISSPLLRRVLWTLAVCIPAFVAFARMTRGMHHPLDVAGGVLVGLAALAVMVFAARAAGHAADVRARGGSPEREVV